MTKLAVIDRLLPATTDHRPFHFCCLEHAVVRRDEAMVQPILFLTLLHLIMTIVSASTAYALVPSQVRGLPQYHRSKQKKTTTNEGNDTTRSTPLRATVEGGDGPPAVRPTAGGVIESSSSVAASAAGDDVVYSSAMASTATPISITKNKSTNGKKNKKKNSSSTKNTHRSTQQCKTGNIPDVAWRSISMNHLRAHPNFQPLPPPSHITNLPSREHVRYFRQDSWQWDYLHTGRCTTSQASSALGFLEAKCASYLGIPTSLQRGGFGAFDRLRQCYNTADDQSLGGWERTLCSSNGGQRRSMSTTAAAAATATRIDDDDDDDDHDDDSWSWKPGTKEIERLWKPQLHNKSYPFAAMYCPTLTHKDLYRRKVHLGGGEAAASAAPMRTRMEWGNVQEATSILTALNYFCKIDNTTIIREVGMCGASFDDNATNDETIKLLQGVKIGASPDAFICHGNGSIEVLEVKNHCPFVWNRVHNNNSNRYNKHQRMEIERQRGNRSHNDTNESHRFSIRDFELEQKIPPAYLPQLMMEMLCVGTSVTLNDKESTTTNNSTTTAAVAGPICKSAIMVRQTATKGAIILRLPRDDDWINEMKYWLGMFQANYVSTNTIPNDNFFWSDDPDSRYRKFVTRTKEISESVELVAYIDQSQIQRMLLRKGEEGRGGVKEGDEIPLFLDSIIADVS